MSLFVTVNIDQLEPELGSPDAERVLEGAPTFKTWNVEETADGVYAGVWEATRGKWRIRYDEWEFCHIVSGVSVVTEDGASPRRVEAGSSFVLRPGFKGTWEVLETTRKEYVLHLPPAVR